MHDVCLSATSAIVFTAKHGNGYCLVMLITTLAICGCDIGRVHSKLAALGSQNLG
jgi:hypothetical protein